MTGADVMLRRQNILVVDDDPRIGRMLRGYLESESFGVSVVENGHDLRRALAEGDVDLAIIDISMPGEDGLSLTRELRKTSDLAIILLSDKDSLVDRIVGLELGADDCVVKPFEPRELLARIRTILRRTGRQPRPEAFPQAASGRLHFMGWTLEPAARQLIDPSGADMHLTSLEFELLFAFASQPNRVLTRDQLLDRCAGRAWMPDDRSIDVHVGKLRRKLEPDPAHPRLIKTIRGTGYLFTASVERA